MMNRVQRLPDWLRFCSRQAAVLTALVTCLLLAPWVAEAQGVNSAPTFGESGLLVYANDTGSTATTYTDSDAMTPGERYTYRVKALRGDQESTHSNYARVDLPQTTPPTTTTLEPTPLPREHEDSDSDYEAEINASESLTVGSVRTVSITPAGDEDWFEIDLDATKSYSIQLTDHSRHDGQVYPRLMGIRDSEGNLILGTTEGTGWFYEGGTTHHILDPMETGKYYIVVGLHQPDNWSFWGLAITGDYQIEVVEVETDDVAGDLSTTATLTVGQTRSLVAELPGDRDWFRVGLLRDHTYRVEALGSPGSKFPSLYGVRDSEGVRLPDTIEHSIIYSNQPVAWIRQFFTVPEDGDYYIDLGAYPETTGEFWLTLYDDTEDDFPDDITTTGTAPIDGSVTGNIEIPGDRDWFRTTMDTGMEYRIDVNTKRTWPHLAVVPNLHGIYDVDGNLIDGTSGGGSRLYFQPPNNGTYYISARSYTHTWQSAYDRSTGEYVLAVSAVPVDLPDDASTTGSVADTRPVSGEVNQAHEKDWYRLDAVVGQSYEIYLSSPGSWNHGTCDPYLVGVYDPFGNLIPGTRHDNIHGHYHTGYDALDALSHFTAEADGAHHVSVSGHCSGTYFLMAYEEKDDLPADTTTTGVVEVGGALSGRIESKDDDDLHQHDGQHWHHHFDQDWIRVALTEGQSYRVRLRARWENRPPHGTISYLYLGGIHDSDGNYIDGTARGETSDAMSGVYLPKIKFTAPETGDFYIEVGGRPYDHGTYVLDVTQETQLQSANTPATGAPSISGTAQVGQTLTAITSGIDDADGLVNASFSYQWQRQDLGTSAETDIPGATGATYEVTSDDRDSAVRVSVSFSDAAENIETLTSYWLLTQAPSNNLPTGVPTISGTAQVGGMLTAHTSSIADADGLTNATYGYQWIASKGSSDVEIANATAPTYTVAAEDAGWTIQVRVTFTDDADNEQTLTSEATEAVEFAVQPQRANTPATGTLTISGTAEVGETLTAITSGIDDADGLVNASFDYQWQRQDLGNDTVTDILGATGATYEVTSDDRDSAVRVSVSFSDAAENSETLTSYWVLVQQPANNLPTGVPTISGTVQVGGMLTAHTSSIADADGLTNVSYEYQWIASDSNSDVEIANATAPTYTVAAEDEGWTILVRVTFTDDADHEQSLTSAATALAQPPAPDGPPDTPNRPNATAVFVGGVDLEWNDVFGAESYDVQLGRGGQWIDLPGGGVEVAFYGAGAIISGLDPEASLWFQVRAVNARGVSDWSEMLYTGSTSQFRLGRKARPDNEPAGGAPVIHGTAQVGESLWGEATGLEDGNGLDRVEFQYQWVSGDGNADTDIAGATNSGYTLVSDDVGQTIRVKVAFTDRGGYSETRTSVATGAVAARPNNPATGRPTIGGRAEVGETLTADTSGIADADGLLNATYSYQWVANDGGTDADISGETDASYTLVADDAGNTIKVRVIVTDDAGNETTLTSAATDEVSFAVQQQQASNTPATGKPTIGGTAEVGETLTADTSGITDADGLVNATYRYQWVANDGGTDTDISGETDANYTLLADDAGQTIKVRVIVTDDAGNETTLTSAATDEVSFAVQQQQASNTPATGVPTIGGTAEVGETLTADTTGIARGRSEQRLLQLPVGCQ